MEKGDELRLSEEEKRLFGEQEQKKKAFRIQIPDSLRFALIWTIFFAIAGIIIQSIRAGGFVFIDFFVGNYAAWFRSFGAFTDPTAYASGLDLFYAIMRDWYYFLYSGGLISLLWSLISGLINQEIVFKAKEKQKPKATTARRSVPIPRTKGPEIKHISEMDTWLAQGYRMLAARRIKPARLIYESLRRQYDPTEDPKRKYYKRILEFHKELIKTDKKLRGKK